ncbi:MAG: ABC transporter ATP-binding protein [Candidatus Heimdallarchaeota archaeon]
MNLRHRGKFIDLAEEAEREEHSRVTSDLVLGKWVIGYLKGDIGLVILAFIFIAISTGLGMVSPYISGAIIDQGFGENPIVDGNYQKLLMYCLILFGIAVSLTVINLLKNFILYRIGYSSVKRIRSETFAKLQGLSMEFFDKQEGGRIISRVTNDCDKINELMSGSIITSLTDFLTVIGVSIFLIVMNWELGLITICVSVPPTILISYIFKVRAREAYRKTRKTIANITSTLSEGINGVKVSQSFTRERENIREFQKVNLEDRKANIRAEAIFAATYPIFNFLSSAVVGFVYLYAGWTIYYSGSTIHLPITPGEAIAFTQYIGMFFNPILNLTMFYNTFQSTMAAAERLYELNQQTASVLEKEDAYVLPRIKGEVKFKDVSFAYVDEQYVLWKFNLHVRPGESIAIVGPTGAGKTTIVNLLARFYEVQKGAITIDGHDIRNVTLESLHSQMGIVLQQPVLFKGTIKENIAYAHPDTSLKRIIKAAKVVNAHDFIKHLPDGYDTDIGESGKRLSVGQKQLISFARAILHNPRILILDEATSSVDPYTELLIKKALTKLLKNRTSFIIAHRLSTVRNADRIIVLQQGKIVEEGTNEELLAKKGEYYNLYQLQFKEQEEQEEKLEDDPSSSSGSESSK